MGAASRVVGVNLGVNLGGAVLPWLIALIANSKPLHDLRILARVGVRTPVRTSLPRA
jgi:uncharacterized membrane protein